VEEILVVSQKTCEGLLRRADSGLVEMKRSKSLLL